VIDGGVPSPGSAGNPGHTVSTNTQNDESEAPTVTCAQTDAQLTPATNASCPAPVDWARVLTPHAPSNHEWMGLTNDADGNAYVLSTILGWTTIDDEDVGVDDRRALLFVSYDPTGGVRWIQEIDDATAEAIAISDRQVCIFGSTEGFGSSMPPKLLDPEVQGLDFLICYDLNGGAIWSRHLDSSLIMYASMATDSRGNVYVAGQFRDDLKAAAGMTINEHQHEQLASGDGFLISYSASGEARFARSFGGAGVDSCDSVAVTSDDQVAVAGSFEQTIEVDGTELKVPGIFSAPFLIELDSEGKTEWALRPEGDDYTHAGSLVSGPDGGVVVGVGGLSGSFAELIEYDTSGVAGTRGLGLELGSALARTEGGYVRAGGYTTMDGGSHPWLDHTGDDLETQWTASYTFAPADLDVTQGLSRVSLAAGPKGVLIGGYASASEQQYLLHVQPR
jgi:hypothetical protein